MSIKNSFSIIGCLLLGFISSVSGQELYYFTDKDSIQLGVKSATEIIVPLGRHRITYEIDFSKPILTPIFELPGSLNKSPLATDNPAMPSATVYNRKGEPLYYTLWFDNGSDYFSEDLQRIIALDNGKIGFADEEGNIKISPEWDFAIPFNYGYATVLRDIKKERIDEEHWTVVPNSSSSFKGYMNKNGNLITPSKTKKHEKDYVLEDGEYLPYPFSYTKDEQDILKRFEEYYEIINDISLHNYYSSDPKSEVSLQFEIIKRPTEHFPYYKIQGYRKQRTEDDYTFLFNTEAQTFHYIDYPYSLDQENIKPIKEHILEKLERIIEYDKQASKHKSSYPFDIDHAYQKWR
ncbi:WG repeat-containing protein [Sphingobacterium tabacisoli]|uniref:WG repeat-containing protein n=1 Tax=Sphingobacterium tabacisoli TaxID=2044855 RepID=A0ABW5KVK5_9SPHI|nr:WG repeat-containing protein [Sphingobacterium tabacisoli]